MKKIMINSLIASGLALAAAAAVGVPMLTSADQLKGAQLLIAKSARAVATTSAPAQLMACVHGKNELANREDADSHCAIKPVIATQKHTCGMSETSSKMTGMGKPATQTPTHACNMNGKEIACCCN